MHDIYIFATVRTAIGTFGGSLKDSRPVELGEIVARAAIAGACIVPEAVDLAVFGQVIPTEPSDAYLARVAAISAGVPVTSPALTVNRLCGSGLQAIVSAAQSLMLGDGRLALAGGVEVMSRAPFFAPGVRWGRRMGDAQLVDGVNGALTDPFGHILTGVTAENVAERYGITREAQDAFAAESHRRAAAAIAAGYFNEQIVPVERVVRGKPVRFDQDEYVRPETTERRWRRCAPSSEGAARSLRAMRPASMTAQPQSCSRPVISSRRNNSSRWRDWSHMPCRRGAGLYGDRPGDSDTASA